jgi:hypothetical protein
MTHEKQREMLAAGHTLVGEGGIQKRILTGDWTRRIDTCLGFRNLGGTWFYGACLFPEDENVEVKK